MVACRQVSRWGAVVGRCSTNIREQITPPDDTVFTVGTTDGLAVVRWGAAALWHLLWEKALLVGF